MRDAPARGEWSWSLGEGLPPHRRAACPSGCSRPLTAPAPSCPPLCRCALTPAGMMTLIVSVLPTACSLDIEVQNMRHPITAIASLNCSHSACPLVFLRQNGERPDCSPLQPAGFCRSLQMQLWLAFETDTIEQGAITELHQAYDCLESR